MPLLSKLRNHKPLLRLALRWDVRFKIPPKIFTDHIRFMGLIKKTQYTPKFTKRLWHLPTVWKYNSEVFPILIITVGAFVWLFVALMFFAYNKVEIKFARDDKTISESMNLKNPTVHKFVTITYPKPWPELADLLADMEQVELRNYRIMKGQEK